MRQLILIKPDKFFIDRDLKFKVYVDNQYIGELETGHYLKIQISEYSHVFDLKLEYYFKGKLDNVIYNQSRIIAQNAFIAAQNHAMIEQNQSILNELAAIESNTARTAQYTQIASNNVENVAWIQKMDWLFKP